MNYDNEIVRILLEVGERGLSVTKISRHVFNACNTLFAPIDYDDVHQYVAKYLLKNSKDQYSLFTRNKRGVYCLNLRSEQTCQLLFDFQDDNLQKDESKPDTGELSLSLF